jgi:UDP-N-acetylglucosamine--N-acetylmuramyl-(pentapeptide) pyrophosphoryl-undecaprenol N-acetylglucosamine transferase
MRIAFAGGGTGGHVYPALAVAREILKRRPETEVLFIGGTRGIERKIAGGAGFPVETITACGMPRKTSPAIFSFAWKLGASILRSRSILKRFRPRVVMATGGYVSGPPVIAAHFLGIPAVIQEQNSYPGITNRKLARYSDLIFTGFEDARKYFPDRAEVIDRKSVV